MTDEHPRIDEDERPTGRLASLAAEHDAAPQPGAADVATSPLAPAATQEPTLGALVTALGRRTPDALLAASVVVGLVGAAAIALAAPAWWRTIAPLILLATFGARGIADRERDAVGLRGAGIAVVRVVVLLASFAAAGAMILTFLGVAIGTWIS